MRSVRLVLLVLLWALFFVAVLVTHALLFLSGSRSRWRWISRVINRTFAAAIRRLLNIKVRVEGEARRLREGGWVIVSNHMSYVDGLVLGSLFPLIYVSKKEVRGWPLIGPWTALCGTVYVDRRRKDRIPLLVGEITEKLRQKANVLVFPEGTSTNGERLLSFQSAPFAAPLRARAGITPVTLTYRKIDDQPLDRDNRDRIYWYGDMDFLPHFWELLAVRRIDVTVRLHAAIEVSRYRNDSLGRKMLSQAAYDSIAGKRKTPHERRASFGPLGPG